eukprot:scaffold140260_cov26-Prasinocladus_malaysianus.AAC.1
MRLVESRILGSRCRMDLPYYCTLPSPGISRIYRIPLDEGQACVWPLYCFIYSMYDSGPERGFGARDQLNSLAKSTT